MNPEIIDEIKAKHPGQELHLLTVRLRDLGRVVEGDPCFEFVALAPRAAAWERYRQAIAAEKHMEAGPGLVRDCVVYPPLPELQAAIGRYPGIEARISDALNEIAGTNAKVEHVKL